MANQINTVEKTKHELRLGWPEGTTHLYKIVPTLLQRINELENALTPFARVAIAEQGNPTPPQLSHVYLHDCVTAFNALDRSQSAPASTERVDNFFSLPAE